MSLVYIHGAARHERNMSRHFTLLQLALVSNRVSKHWELILAILIYCNHHDKYHRVEAFIDCICAGHEVGNCAVRSSKRASWAARHWQ